MQRPNDNAKGMKTPLRQEGKKKKNESDGAKGMKRPPKLGAGSMKPPRCRNATTSYSYAGRLRVVRTRNTRDASFDHLVGATRQRSGTVMPSALAALRFRNSSTFVTC